MLTTIAAVVFFAATTALQPVAAGKATPVATPAAHEPTITSEIFVSKAAMSGLYEVEAGKLALTRSKNLGVRGFAERMVNDHNASAVELSKLVANKTYAIPVALLLDVEHQEKLKDLRKTSDSNFDTAYGLSMREGHEEAVRAFTLASAETYVDADLRAFATKTLPVLKAHQDLAMTLPVPKEK